MTKRAATVGLMLCATALQGCSAGLHNAPLDGPPPDRAVVLVGDIINNMKCDMLSFVRDNPMLATPGRTIGGTLTFTVDRSHAVEGGVTVGIPIATNVQIGANAAGKNGEVFGETISTPFVMRFDPADQSAGINCTPENRTVRVLEPGNPEPVQRTLSAPLLNLAELRRQLDVIEHGQPRVQFFRFNFKGSIVLTRSRGGGLNIKVLWINPTYTNNVSSSFKIDYEIGTDWERILKDAKVDAASPPTTSQWLARLPEGFRADVEANLSNAIARAPDPTMPATATATSIHRVPSQPTRASWLARIGACEARGIMDYDTRGVRVAAQSRERAAIDAKCSRDPASFPTPPHHGPAVITLP